MKLSKRLFSLAALVLLPALSWAQSSATTASPYAPRVQGYTSLDNPYAAGGIYGTRSQGQRRSAAAADPAEIGEAGSVSLDSDRPACSGNRFSQNSLSGNTSRAYSPSSFSNSTPSIARLNRPFAASAFRGNCLSPARNSRNQQGLGKQSSLGKE